MQGIYKIVNKVNGKYYVGSTNDFARRWRYEHRTALRKGKHKTIHLQNAWNKHGEENFEFQIVEILMGDKESLICCEQEYLDSGFSNGVLYNKGHLARGGDLPGEASKMWGSHHSDETKQKIGKANGGENSWWFGKKHTEETKAKMSKSQRGEKNHRWGKSPSKETRRKQSIAHRGNDANAKPYPAFFNDLTSEFIGSGCNLYRMCEVNGCTWQNMRNLKIGVNLTTKDVWRLATNAEQRCYGSV